MEKRPLKRVYVYADIYYKIMQWGSRMTWEGKISKPPNSKINFPYYMENYIEKKNKSQS